MFAIIFFLLFLSTPFSSAQAMTIPEAKQVMIQSAERHNVDPAFVMAVARIESGKKKKEFTLGRIGKTYYGPMGIHKRFLKKWKIDDPKTNIEIGTMTFSGCRTEKQQKSKLKTYNKSFSPRYWLSIKSTKHKYEQELRNAKAISRKVSDL